MALLKAPDCVVATTVIFPDPPDEIVIADGFVANDTVVVPPELTEQLDVKGTGPEI
jgi:hypothetical protein